jgi:hypothetical protein
VPEEKRQMQSEILAPGQFKHDYSSLLVKTLLSVETASFVMQYFVSPVVRYDQG